MNRKASEDPLIWFAGFALLIICLTSCSSPQEIKTTELDILSTELILSPTPTQIALPTPIPTPTPTQKPWVYTDFPYVSQNGEGALYDQDCGSASILMVASYYGLTRDETVDETHKSMMGGDFPTNYKHIVGYLEQRYGLEINVVVTDERIKTALEQSGFDVEDIEIVDDIPFDVPVIWSYKTVPHWVVRFRGWNYDPFNGTFEFDQTAELRKINKPEWGLGIVVYQGDTQPLEPEPVIVPDISDFEVPETIRVRITNTEDCGNGRFFTVEVLDFKEYVKGALAAEWGGNWTQNSLRAGAIAVKTYAIMAVREDPKYSASEWAPNSVADIYDCTWDMGYRPDWRTEKSDKAVDDTWDYFLLDEETHEPFYTLFNARDIGCEVRGEKGRCMGQWESLKKSHDGMDWKNILLTYYKNTEIVHLDGGYYQNKYIAELDNEYIAGDPVVYKVKPGDTLSSIAEEVYGDPTKYYYVYLANQKTLGASGTIKDGDYLVLPEIKQFEFLR